MRARAVAANRVVGFWGSDPNSGQSLRAGQRGLLGSDRNFEQAEGGANLGSDPNNPLPNNPRTASAAASKCVVDIDALLFVFILAPLYPPALSRPAGREREPTAIFGRVYKQRKYTRRGTLNTNIYFAILNSFFWGLAVLDSTP